MDSFSPYNVFRTARTIHGRSLPPEVLRVRDPLFFSNMELRIRLRHGSWTRPIRVSVSSLSDFSMLHCDALCSVHTYGNIWQRSTFIRSTIFNLCDIIHDYKKMWWILVTCAGAVIKFWMSPCWDESSWNACSFRHCVWFKALWRLIVVSTRGQESHGELLGDSS